MAPVTALGIDFGTTNTVVAIADAEGAASTIRFSTPAGGTEAAFRSVLCFREAARDDPTGGVDAGPWAIDSFLNEPHDARLIQSFKAFAASAAFSGTSIFGKRFQFEDLLSLFLRRLWGHAGSAPGETTARAVVGRPVVFAGSNPDEALALRRYGVALERIGLHRPAFAYEPVGAAFFFARRLQGAATVLVADFGGGTSDFSILRFRRDGGRVTADPLSRSGVGVAGDAFDYRIIDNVISPHLGKGSGYRSGGKILPVPGRYYAAFARWNQLALMKWSRDMREIREISRTAINRDAIGGFVELLEDGHGYRLYQSVAAVKEALSSADSAELRFDAGNVHIHGHVRRSDFETWIGAELRAIEQAVDRALDGAGLKAGDIDRVFLTGGSSFVPAVRGIFASRFGAGSIESGGEFESIATGLAMIGAQPDVAAWTHGG